MFRSPSVHILALTAALISASSCSMKKNMDEMHDDTHKMAGTTEKMAKTTEDMKTTTEGMSKTTEDMKKTTDGMSKTTCVMYRSLRQGSSKVSRDQDLQDIVAAKNIAGRLAEAAEYMQGFEYQAWSPACIDELSRDAVIEQGARELLAKVQGYINDRSNVSATQSSKNAEVIYALAATLHYANTLQGDLLKGTEYPVMRPFDVLVKGLELDQARNRGESNETNYPAYAEVVGKYEKDAEYLLRVRANFLMAYAYSIADSDSFGNGPSKVEKIVRVLGSKLFSKKWRPELAARTSTEIRERMTTPLLLALETRNALVKLGIKPMTDQTILELWKNADFSTYNLAKMDQAKSAEIRGKSKAIRELKEVRDLLLKTK